MKTEKVLAFIILSGMLLTFFHIPGGKIFLILSMSILSLLYFPFGFYFLSDKRIDNKTVGFSIISGLMLSTLVTGVLFNMTHWTGAIFLLTIGSVSCIPIAIISYMKYTKPKSDILVLYYKNIFIRVVALIILGLLSFAF